MSDDIFHNVVMSEEIGKHSGFEAGKEVGKQAGIIEGKILGWEKGSSIGSEVGFYAGYAETLLEILQTEKESKPRAIKALQRMQTLTQEYPMTDPLNPELQAKLEELRTKFKQVCSVLGIKQDAPKMTQEKGISF